MNVLIFSDLHICGIANHYKKTPYFKNMVLTNDNKFSLKKKLIYNFYNFKTILFNKSLRKKLNHVENIIKCNCKINNKIDTIILNGDIVDFDLNLYFFILYLCELKDKYNIDYKINLIINKGNHELRDLTVEKFKLFNKMNKKNINLKKQQRYFNNDKIKFDFFENNELLFKHFYIDYNYNGFGLLNNIDDCDEILNDLTNLSSQDKLDGYQKYCNITIEKHKKNVKIIVFYNIFSWYNKLNLNNCSSGDIKNNLLLKNFKKDYLYELSDLSYYNLSLAIEINKCIKNSINLLKNNNKSLKIDDIHILTSHFPFTRYRDQYRKYFAYIDNEDKIKDLFDYIISGHVHADLDIKDNIVNKKELFNIFKNIKSIQSIFIKDIENKRSQNVVFIDE